MNRETWLNNLANLMAPRFEELDHPLPKFHVSIGFTSGGQHGKASAECWHSSRSADKAFQIFISPVRDETLAIAGSLAHELTHAAVGFDCGHKGDFAKVMKALGFVAPLTSSTRGEAFVQWVQPFLDQLGPIPHARLGVAPSPLENLARDLGDADGDEPEAKGSSNQKKKQTTRMLKAACQAPGEDGQPCGYTVRLSKKWALELGACCPVHGAMEVEGADESGGDDDADQ
jgi:hypothetical protein